jgi:ubiquinone/menaquinone biosynthesis C-methylase UbiE
MLGLLKDLHHKYVHLRRVDVLASELARLIPEGSHVLDVGCGDGTIDQDVMRRKAGVKYAGIDIMARRSCAIPFSTYDGHTIPHDNASFDVVQFIDMLHHTQNIEELFAEGVRVSKRYVILKDHSFANRIEHAVIKWMDWVGNAPHGVRLPYNFKDLAYWRDLAERHNLEIRGSNSRVPLYPFPFSEVFGRDGMDFVLLLEKRGAG